MHFSHRTGSDRPNRIALAESEARAHGLKLGRLNDSNQKHEPMVSSWAG